MKNRGIAAVALLSCFLSGTAEAANRKGVEADLLLGFSLEYTDNLFHFSEEQLDEFDTEQAPGQRFFDLEEPEDIIARFDVAGDWRFDTRRKEDLRLGAGGSYFAHMQNDIADYPELFVVASYELTKRDRIRGDVNVIADRFRKNLRIANTAIFDAAEYDQVDITAGYEREVGKHWNVGGDIRLLDRSYNDMFEARDQDGQFLRLFTDYRMRKGIHGESQFEFGAIETDSELDGLVMVDRSYDQWRIEQEFRFKLPKDFELGLGLEARRREYTTNETTDLARYTREDDRLGFSVGLEKELRNDLTFELALQILDNDSSRIDPGADADEIGYEENRLRVGLSYRR